MYQYYNISFSQIGILGLPNNQYITPLLNKRISQLECNVKSGAKCLKHCHTDITPEV